MNTIFFDVDTQIDFLFPAGALWAPGAESIVPGLAELTRFAAKQQSKVISTVDAHAEDDPEFSVWPPHCVVGTAGQQKTFGTLLSRPALLSSTPAPLDFRLEDAQQIILEKQAIDCFTNTNLRPLLDRLAAERYVLYGVVTEVCVRCAAFGLLETGARVELVSDAVKALDPAPEREFLRHFQAQGGVLTTIAAVTA